MLTCKDITELVTDDFDGRLRFMDRVRIRIHVARCAGCRAFLSQMRTTIGLLGAITPQPMPAAAREEMLERFRSHRPVPWKRAGHVPWSLGMLVALERVAGARWRLIVAGILSVSVAAAFASSGGQEEALGDGLPCLLGELGAGLALVGLLALIAITARTRLSAPTLALVAIIGAVASFGFLQLTCPMAHALRHVLVFHEGGVILAGILGATAARLPGIR